MTLYRCYTGPPAEGTRRADCGCHYVNDTTLIHYWGCPEMEAHRQARWDAQRLGEASQSVERLGAPSRDEFARRPPSASLDIEEEGLGTGEWTDEDEAEFVAEWVDEHGYHPDQLCERCGTRPIPQIMPFVYREPPKGYPPDEKRDRLLYCHECIADDAYRGWPF